MYIIHLWIYSQITHHYFIVTNTTSNYWGGLLGVVGSHTTAIVTFIVTYNIICVKRKFVNIYNPNDQSPQEKVLCQQVGPSSHTISKNDFENPVYAISHKVIMGINPAYESCK